MRFRVSGFGALAALALLCACGGGGSSGSPAVIPTPSTSAAPVTPDPHPTASGDAFAYAGTMSVKFAYVPAPSASPWTSTDKETIVQNVSVKSGATFNGESGLSDLSSQEIDTGQHATTTMTTDQYVAYAPSASRAGGTDVLTAGIVSKDSNGVTTTTTFAAGNGVLDELPETAGAQWTNTAARTETESDPDTQTSTSTYAGDGTYAETFTYPQGGTAAVVTHDDGSAVYQFPLLGQQTNSTLTIAPVSGKTITGELTTIPGFPGTTLFAIDDWYPSTPPQAASDSFVNDGLAAVPSSCGTAAGYTGAQAMKIVETRQRLDVMFGQVETLTQTSYVNANFGVVCLVTHDDLQWYYDFSGEGPSAFTFSTVPVQTTTVDETLGLQNEKLTAGRRRANVAVVAARATAIAVRARSRFARELYSNLRTRTHS